MDGRRLMRLIRIRKEKTDASRRRDRVTSSLPRRVVALL